MTGRQGLKPKHIPQRTCVGCRQVMAKRNLIRIASTAEGVVIDPSGKTPGRGAYLHDLKPCWTKALKGPLAAALRVTLSDTDKLTLTMYMDGLAEKESENAEISAEKTPAKDNSMT